MHGLTASSIAVDCQLSQVQIPWFLGGLLVPYRPNDNGLSYKIMSDNLSIQVDVSFLPNRLGPDKFLFSAPHCLCWYQVGGIHSTCTSPKVPDVLTEQGTLV